MACDDVGFLTEADNLRTVQVATGELIRIQLAVDPEDTGTVPRIFWGSSIEPDPELLEPLTDDELGEAPRGKVRFGYRAIAPGSTRIVVEKLERVSGPAGEPFTQRLELFDITVEISGEALPRDTDYLQGFLLAGGLGDSVADQTPLSSLRLRPTDLTVGRLDGQLYVPSEGRLWRIDPTARVGTLFYDLPDARLNVNLPTAATVTSAEQGADGQLLLGLRDGGDNVVALIGTDQGYTQLDRRPSPLPLVRVRRADDGVRWVAGDRVQVYSGGDPATGAWFQSPDSPSVEIEGDAVRLLAPLQTAFEHIAGRDNRGRLLFWGGSTPHDAGLWLSTEPDVSLELFQFLGSVERIRESDFFAWQSAGENGVSSWIPLVASVGQTPDGRYWSFSVPLVDTGDFIYEPQTRGLFVSE